MSTPMCLSLGEHIRPVNINADRCDCGQVPMYFLEAQACTCGYGDKSTKHLNHCERILWAKRRNDWARSNKGIKPPLALIGFAVPR